MSALTAFLLARIAEDETVARDALAPENMHPWGDRSIPPIDPSDVPDEMRGYLGGPWGEHAARWHMTRVLAECETKRQIIQLASARATAEALLPGGRTHPGLTPARHTLHLLAQPYTDHAEYRATWAP